VLEAIAGADPHDPTAARRPFRYDDGEVAGRRFRFGVIRDVATAAEPAVRETKRVVKSVARKTARVTTKAARRVKEAARK